MRFSDWLRVRGQAHFGHARYPRQSPADRVHYVVQEILRVIPDDYNIAYIVADEFEKILLTAAVKHQFPGLLGESGINGNTQHETNSVAILDYTSGCSLLRKVPSWSGWKKRHVIFVCEVDIHYSAAFAIFFLSLYKWSKDPSSSSTLRVATLSALETPENSILRAMDRVWPGPYTFSRIDFHQPQPLNVWRQFNWSDEAGFIKDSIAHIAKAVRGNSAGIVLCQPEVLAAISSEVLLRGSGVMKETNALKDSNRLASGIGLLGQQFLIVGLIHTSRLLFPVPNSACIAVSDIRQAPLWTRGRIIHTNIKVSQREIEELCYSVYHVQKNATYDAAAEPTLVLPTGSRPEWPPRRLENDQLLGFVADVAMMFSGTECNTYDILKCFITNGQRVYMAFQYFETVRFLMEEPCFEIQPTRLPVGKLGHIFRQVLVMSDFDFDSSWFLANGLVSPCSDQAKRAMAYMAAIVEIGGDVIRMDLARGFVRAAATDKLDTVARALGIDFPPALLADGWLWVALACVENYLGKTEDDPGQLKVKCGTDALLINGSVVQSLDRRARDLAKPVGQGNIFTRGKALRLDTQDLDHIHTAMVNAWIHKTLMVEPVDGADQGMTTDMLARKYRDASIVADDFEFVYPAYQKFNNAGDGHPSGRYFIAPLKMTLAQSERGLVTKYTMSIVLPLKFIREWRSPGGDNIFWGLVGRQRR